MYNIQASYDGPYMITKSMNSGSYSVAVGQHIVIKENGEKETCLISKENFLK